MNKIRDNERETLEKIPMKSRTTKLENLEQSDRFLHIYSIQRDKQSNSSITSNDIEMIIQNLLTKNSGFSGIPFRILLELQRGTSKCTGWF